MALITVEVLLTDLHNPRGVAVDDDGGLLVAEAGLGDDAPAAQDRSGRLTMYNDQNRDGDFEDPGEVTVLFKHLASYNAMFVYATGRDEVSGPSDLAVHDDGRILLSVDGGFGEFSLFEISKSGSMGRNLASRSNMTGIALSADGKLLYVSESSLNRLIVVDLESGLSKEVVVFGDLESGQQSVPAGLAVDPTDGTILVTLFSGVAQAPDGSFIPFVSGESKVVRVNPMNGEITDVVVGLTTAVDVAVDQLGRFFVVELASGYADLLDRGTDLFDRTARPLHGGYLRFTGRVTMFHSAGGTPTVLADGLDSPTNITLADGFLYVSTGQGTPGRPIPGPDGPSVIIGEVIRIAGF